MSLLPEIVRPDKDSDDGIFRFLDGLLTELRVGQEIVVDLLSNVRDGGTRELLIVAGSPAGREEEASVPSLGDNEEGNRLRKGVIDYVDFRVTEAKYQLLRSTIQVFTYVVWTHSGQAGPPTALPVGSSGHEGKGY